MNTGKFRDFIKAAAVISGVALCSGTVWADESDTAAERIDQRGDRIEERLDNRGDRIDDRLDRRLDHRARRVDRRRSN